MKTLLALLLACPFLPPAFDGGTSCSCGVVYKLSPGRKGKWKYTVLHTFSGNDGAQPDANLILDGKGNLYGTTATGRALFDPRP
jgi:hypothetical protein